MPRPAVLGSTSSRYVSTRHVAVLPVSRRSAISPNASPHPSTRGCEPERITGATAGSTCPALLLARVLLSGLRLKLVADEPFIADDLRIVARLDHVCLAGPDLKLRAVVMNHTHPSRLHNAQVPVLAAVR